MGGAAVVDAVAPCEVALAAATCGVAATVAMDDAAVVGAAVMDDVAMEGDASMSGAAMVVVLGTVATG
jgi:hypothetical protein